MVEMTHGLRVFLIVVLVGHGLCILFGMIRAARASRFTDGIVAVNVIGTVAILILSILSYMLGESYLVDVAILYALVNMVAVVVLCRIARIYHMEHAESGKKEEEDAS